MFLVMRDISDAFFSRSGKANIVTTTMTITLSDCQIHFSRRVKANTVISTFPITVSDCHFFLLSGIGKANIVMFILPFTVSDCNFFFAKW